MKQGRDVLRSCISKEKKIRHSTHARYDLTPRKILVDLIANLLFHEFGLSKIKEGWHVAVPDLRSGQGLEERIDAVLRMVIHHDADDARIGARNHVATLAQLGEPWQWYVSVGRCGRHWQAAAQELVAQLELIRSLALHLGFEVGLGGTDRRGNGGNGLLLPGLRHLLLLHYFKPGQCLVQLCCCNRGLSEMTTPASLYMRLPGAVVLQARTLLQALVFESFFYCRHGACIGRIDVVVFGDRRIGVVILVGGESLDPAS